MKANEYQELAGRTLSEMGVELTLEEINIAWNAIGLAGEAGEVSDLIKKGIFHRHGLDIDKIKAELGDVCWYVAALCSCLGLTLEEVMTYNIEKLKKRYPEGYSHERSINRDY